MSTIVSEPKQRKKNYKNLIILICCITAAAIYLIASNGQSYRAQKAEAVEREELKKIGIISTDFDEFIKEFDSKTQVQQKEFWESIQGKKVQWTGEIEDVRTGLIDKNKNIITVKSGNKRFNAILSDDKNVDISSLNKSTKITIRGNLSTRKNIVTEWEISEAEIIKNNRP
ncbi:hypothetical protein [Paenibacillus ehimensis]|uniref:hypothetical protein n=1 Tax=Paenibacillus ehimensis TaxID=79264 RepID=UPI0004705838|nr:hypothetical protein [Paenibacillus ehimensis]